MSKSPRRPLAVVALLVASIGMTGACRPGSLLPGLGPQPLELAGAWVDSAKSSPMDTSLWVLGVSGNDGSRRIIRAPDGVISTTDHHYGYWFFKGKLDDPNDRAICFTKRPGRSAPTCLPFSLDTVMSASGQRRRLIVRGYQGAHSTMDRVLIAYGQ